MASEDFKSLVVAATILVGFIAVVYLFRKAFSKGCRFMGNSSEPSTATGPLQPPKLTKCPSDIRKINDTVYEMYAPNRLPQVEIVFFHGLQLGDYKDAFWKTWLSETGSLVWPKEWLSQSFPNARILAISYDSCARMTPTTGRIDMYRLGENLLNNLVLNHKANVGQNCPVILVGHSLGGLALKQFILSSHRKKHQTDPEKLPYNSNRIDKLFSNFCGVFYYGTPHVGSRLADIAAQFPTSSRILSYLRTLNTETTRINEGFERLCNKFKIQVDTDCCGDCADEDKASWTSTNDRHDLVHCICGNLNLSTQGFEAVVVSEASAIPGSDTVTPEPCDHFNVCKPRDKESPRFQALEKFIIATLPKGAITHIETSAEQDEVQQLR